jgi:hypothetical protein
MVTESQAVATTGVVSLVVPLDLLIDALRSHLILPVSHRGAESGNWKPVTLRARNAVEPLTFVDWTSSL